jgi:hypothetical protein
MGKPHLRTFDCLLLFHLHMDISLCPHLHRPLMPQVWDRAVVMAACSQLGCLKVAEVVEKTDELSKALHHVLSSFWKTALLKCRYDPNLA